MTTSDKITCKDCGSVISFKYLTKHLLTKKHLNSINGVEVADTPRKEKARVAFKQYYQANKEIVGDEEHRASVALKKWLQRHPDKTASEYTPRGQRKERPSLNAEVITKLVEDEIKGFREEKKQIDLPVFMKKLVKEKVEQVQLDIVTFANREELEEKITKVAKIMPLTLKVNLDRVKNIYQRVFHEPWDYRSFEWVRDTEHIYKEVRASWKNNSEKTISNQFVSIAGILKFMKGFEKEHKIYSKLGSNIVVELDELSKDNNLNARQLKKAMNWADILKTGPLLSDENDGNSFLRALFGIYTDIAPRRAKDYILMKIVRKDKLKQHQIEKLDKKFNYLFIDKNKKPLSMTIYNYKESSRRLNAKRDNSYGQYVADIPKVLADKLQEYIIEESLNSNDFLFGLDNNHQKSYSSSGYSGLVSQNLFKAFTGVPVDINGLRHSYVSWFFPHLKTYKEKERLTYEMGTTMDEAQMTYLKNELTRPA